MYECTYMLCILITTGTVVDLYISVAKELGSVDGVICVYTFRNREKLVLRDAAQADKRNDAKLYGFIVSAM